MDVVLFAIAHIWTVDFLKVKPGMFKQALALLDVGWERTRAEAKKASDHRLLQPRWRGADVC
jgi:hypothetical protein